MDIYCVLYELYEGIWTIKREISTLHELEKMFHLFSNSIDCEISNSINGNKYEKCFRFYSYNQ